MTVPRPFHLAPVLAAAAVCACAGGPRTMRFESTVPASVVSGGEVLCEKTPCEWKLSRETCGLYDSSLGFLRVRAVDEAGNALQAPLLKTCSVREGTLVRFAFGGTGGPCGVDIEEPGGGRSRGECAMSRERPPRR